VGDRIEVFWRDVQQISVIGYVARLLIIEADQGIEALEQLVDPGRSRGGMLLGGMTQKKIVESQEEPFELEQNQLRDAGAVFLRKIERQRCEHVLYQRARNLRIGLATVFAQRVIDSRLELQTGFAKHRGGVTEGGDFKILARQRQQNHIVRKKNDHRAFAQLPRLEIDRYRCAASLAEQYRSVVEHAYFLLPLCE